MSIYKSDKDWSDQFMDQLKEIAGRHLIQIGNPIQDKSEGTDLIVFGGPQRIACRVRRPKFYPRYQFEFTIRSHRDSGAKTEWAKLLDEDENWRHIYLYAFSDEQIKIVAYHVIDIPPFMVYARSLIPDKLPKQLPNGDGTYFIPFDIRRIPIKALIHTTVKQEGIEHKEDETIPVEIQQIEAKAPSLWTDEELAILAKKYHVRHGNFVWEDS